MELAEMQAVVLCGGKGTRAYPHTVEIPKPLLEVAGQPVLRHVLDIYAGQGVRRFLLAAGYKAAAISDFARGLPGAWEVQVVETGEDAGTGTRILRCRDLLEGPFLATYGDGLADVDLTALVGAHCRGGAPVTITTVPLRSQYGTLEIDGSGKVTDFKEKPVLAGHWINGGFFVMDVEVFDSWAGDDLEKQVLPALAAAGRLRAYRHTGFWRSMDTYKDALELSDLADTGPGAPPWMPAPGSRGDT